ncbi:MAG: dihydrolipoyl dehydrogenase [Puniceicoccales bacterium]|jgi:dihydrolipoamide dehydrogenase|nr:dihydrolipoyl dehydrogenase [Puniceicoccales bacterium]
MAEDITYDLVVIGGGPAGYAGAIRAGQLGKKVACIEMERPGGTCLNWGCIPTKALLKSAELYDDIKHAADFGITAGDVKVDFGAIMARSRKVSDQMAKGVEFLFKKNKVEHVVGKGRVLVPGMVEITDGEQKGRVLKTKNILLATGCRPRRLPDVDHSSPNVLTSFETLQLKQCPKSIVILGAGAIGVEFAYFLNTFGAKVHLVEMKPTLLPIEDEEVARAVERAFRKDGINILTGTKSEKITVSPKGVKVALDKNGEKSEIEATHLLVAIGVSAYTEGAISDKVKLETEKNYIKVNDSYQTSVPGIYAAGDVIGPPWLAHIATFEAVNAVNGMFEVAKPRRVKVFPGCTYCRPQVASVGLTEAACKEQGLAYRVAKFPFAANGKAVALNHAEGFVKLITGEKHGEILGAHIVGPEATELIAEYGLAIQSELTWEDIHAAIHAHPTLSEALGEAAAAIHGEAIHI